MGFTNNGIEHTIRIYFKFIATVDLDTQMDRARGVARLTLMVGHTFYNTTYLLLYLIACWFLPAFIYVCFKSAKYE